MARDLTQEDLKRLARLGAQSRLEELRQEEAAIRTAFPELFGGRAGRKAASAGTRGGRRGHMSPAARKAQSLRMKKLWAERRRAKAKAKAQAQGK